MGVLTAMSPSGNGAGIGGGFNKHGGTITINGGNVTATGNKEDAGIGGSGNNRRGGTITINGGIVTATGGSYGAGIGGSFYGAGGTIKINGGTVTAKGGSYGGAGIGGGAGSGSNRGGAGGTIEISGGTVNAIGGTDGTFRAAAGIGGGHNGAGGTITINGGTVTATGRGYYGGSSADIGGGDRGAGGTITINGGTVVASSSGAGIGGGSYGAGGTFVANGNAFIVAGSISDQSGKGDSWKGVIFEGNAGQVYGDSITLTTDAEIPSGKELTIKDGQTLTVDNGVTLTNNGTIKIEQGGTLSNNSTLTGNGTITGSGQLTGTKATQTTPGTGEGYAINCTTEQITIENGYRVSSDKSDTIADGPIDPGKPLCVRKEENNFYNASDWTDFTTPSRGTTPSVSIDYVEEELNTTTAMQYGFEASGYGVQSWASCDDSMAASAFGWDGSAVTVQFRTAATENKYASEQQEVIIPARPAAPAGLQGSKTSFAGESDGEITGLIAGTAYQISSNDGMNWTDGDFDRDENHRPCLWQLSGARESNYQHLCQ